MIIYYQKLLEPITLPNGSKIPHRTAMSPMSIAGANEDGTVSDLDLAYFEKRSDVAGLIIKGAAYINELGHSLDAQNSIAKDEDIPGLKILAEMVKKDGNKVVIQLNHAGRQSFPDKYGRVVAPSAVEYPGQDIIPEELTEEEIEETIKDFGQAAKRAIEAGFDGVEIHGANGYLLQQFFSAYSNRRTDKWGGSLENRSAFTLAVIKEVKNVVEESGKKDFIVGIRVTPEEIDGENVGYRIDELLQLVDKVVKERVDYVHISQFTGYNSTPEGSNKSYGELVREVVNDRCPVIIGSNIKTADDALKALNHGDIVAIGRAALVDPEFTKKIREGRENEIETSVENRLETLAIPEKAIERFKMDGSILPPLPGLKK